MDQPIKVAINLITKIEQDGQTETINQEYFGQLSKEDDVFVLRYAELDSENKSVTFSFYANNIYRLERTGNPRTDFLFNQTVDQLPGTYLTDEIGQINLQVKTFYQNFSIDDDYQKGQVEINYQLFNQEIQLGKFNLSIRFSSLKRA